ncbi:heme peroxidase [Mycena capillaripes]|nr:heme peroxidase [Mycena capillaripes]
MNLVGLVAIGALCARQALAGSWPYTRTLPDGTTPPDEHNDDIPDLFLDWLRSAAFKDDNIKVIFAHGNATHITSLDDLERHTLDHFKNSSDLPKSRYAINPLESSIQDQANALFGHLEFALEPACVQKKEDFWYRSVDGRCNWLKKDESYLGSTGQPRSRDWGQTYYADGISKPREGPNPRELSNAFFQRKKRIAYEHTPLMLGLVEFIMHDVSYSADSDTEKITIPILTGDPWYDPHGHGNRTFTVNRSKPLKGSGTSKSNPRQHANDATAWLDASALYGSTPQVVDALRSHVDGKLKSQRGKDGFGYLPMNVEGLPVRTRPGVDIHDLFLGGDVRTNEDYILLSVHTIFLREHNRLCDIIVQQHPDWDDERIYQTVKLIVGAKVALIGNGYQMAYWDKTMPWPRDDGFPLYRAMYGVNVLKINPLHTYPWPLVTRDDRPMVTSAEMSVIYRFHEFIINNFNVIDAHNKVVVSDTLFNSAFNTSRYLSYGADNILRGMLSADIPKFKSGVDEAYRSAGAYRGSPFDIVTWSIVHEREQGLPTFNQYFRGYANVTPKPELLVKIREKFEDFSSDPEAVEALKRLYKYPDDVDFVVGVQLEELNFPGTTMPISALIPSLFSLFGLGNSDRFSPGYAVMRCILVDKPWDCHPSNALEELIWDARPTKEFPYKRWYNNFWMKELDFQAHGTNLLWRMIMENGGLRCIQKNPLFPVDNTTNPVLCELPQPTWEDHFSTIAATVLAALGGLGALFTHYIWGNKAEDRKDSPPIEDNAGRPFQKDPKGYVLNLAAKYGKTFGLQLAPTFIYFIATKSEDVQFMIDNEKQASLVVLTDDTQLGAVIGRHNFQTQLHASVIRQQLETEGAKTLPVLAGVIQEVVEQWFNEHHDNFTQDGGQVDDFRPLANDLIARVMSRVCIGSYKDVYRKPELIQAFIALDKKSNTIFQVTGLISSFGWIGEKISQFMANFLVWSPDRKIRKFVLPVIKARRDSSDYHQSQPSTSSLLDAFLDAAENDQDVSDLVGGVVVAGMISMTDAFTNALYNIAEQRDDLQRHVCSSEPAPNIDPRGPISNSWNFLRSATLETLRLAGGVVVPARKVIVKGFRISTGERLPLNSVFSASPILMHFNEEYFRNPNDFVADRFVAQDAPIGTAKFLTFGLPKHTCPGRFLAIEGVSIALNTLFFRYDVSLLADLGAPGADHYTYSVGQIVMARKPMPVKFTARTK